MISPYQPDLSLAGKVRRRLTRLTHRRPAQLALTRPTVTISFDDIPATAAHAGAAVLEHRGVRGVFYVCAGLFGREGHMGRFADADEIGSLAERGHEIAGHTFDHIDCHRSAPAALASDLDANDAALARFSASSHFAFPYGEVGPRAKRLLKDRYATLRGVHKGVMRHGDDLNQMPGVGLEGDEGEMTARAWIDRAVQQNAWLILYTHDVRPTPSPWGCTPEALAAVVDHAIASGCDIRTISQVLAT